MGSGNLFLMAGGGGLHLQQANSWGCCRAEPPPPPGYTPAAVLGCYPRINITAVLC